MILDIVIYGHPALRAKGKKILRVDDRIRQIARDLIETMRHANGVGLAAQQIGMPLQLCVVEVADIPDRPSRMWVSGRRVRLENHMPMILVNPEIEPIGEEKETEPEGCLSFPGISGDIARSARIRVKAMDLDGKEWSFDASGLLSRAVQHEHDHLHGILFTDRMDPATLASIQEPLRKLQRGG